MVFIAIPTQKFPNFLPSTFTSEAKTDDIRRNILAARLGLAREYYDQMKATAKKHRRDDLGNGDCASDLLLRIREVAYGQIDDVDDVISVCKLFRDDIVLDNLDKAQLVSVAKYLSVFTLGGDEMARVALRTRLRSILQEDRQLYFEVALRRDWNAGTARTDEERARAMLRIARNDQRWTAQGRLPRSDEYVAAARGGEASTDDVACDGEYAVDAREGGHH